MLKHFQDSVVVITSRDPDNRRFGTGFIFLKEDDDFYVLTCAHVVADVGGIEKVCVEGRQAFVTIQGEIETADLAVLRITGDVSRPVMTLGISANIGDDFSTAGFQLFGKRVLIRKLSGKLGESVGLTYWGQTDRIKAWDLHILDDYQLQPGYSGSPVVSSQGQVIGVVSDRQGAGHRGLAISIEALDQIWVEKPQNLKIHGLIPSHETETEPHFGIMPQSQPIAIIDIEQDLPVAYIGNPSLVYYKIKNNASVSLRINKWQLENISNFDLEILSDPNSSPEIDPGDSWTLEIKLTSQRYGRFLLPSLSCSFIDPHDKEELQYIDSPSKSIFVDIGWENQLIGREDILSTLLTFYERASSGQGQVILIYGNAGDGKSYVINKFLSKSYVSNSVRLQGQCESFHKDLSFLPFKQVLERTLSLPRFASTKDRSEQAHIKLLEAFPQLEQSIPYLTYFLLSDRDNDLEVDSKTGREKFFFAFLQLARSLSKTRPIIFYLEDMQWIDASSLDLLQFLSDHVSDLPILIIGEYRLEEVEAKYGSDQKAHPLTSFIRRNITRSNFDQINIKSMSQKNLVAWISKLFPQNELPETFMNLLYTETEGNPLFAREVLKSLIEQKILCQNETNRWIITDDIGSLGLPSTIEQVIANRIEILSSDERRELENASVIGRDFAYQILQAVSDLDDYVLMDYLENYLDIRLITELENRDDYFRFMHGKMREYVYEATRRFRRRRIHLRLATIMENLYSGSLASVSSIIAYHYKEGGNTEKAIGYYLAAGQEQLSIYSNQEAKTSFSEALSLIKSTSSSTRDDLQHLEALYGLALATRDLNEFNDAIEIYEQVLDIATPLRNFGVIVEAASQLATINSIIGHHNKAQSYCALALEYSKYLDNPTLTLQIANDLVDITRREHRLASIMNNTKSIKQTYSELVTHTLQAFELCKTSHNPTQLVRAYKNMGLLNSVDLDYNSAINMYEQAIELAEQKNDIPSKYVYVLLGDAYHATNQDVKALDAYQSYCNWAIEIGAKHAEMKAYQVLGLQHTYKGAYTEAMSFLQKGLDLFEVVGEKDIYAQLQICKGYIFEQRGEYDRALTKYRQALTVLGIQEEDNSETALLRKLGNFLLLRKDSKLAKYYFMRYLELSPASSDKDEIEDILNTMGYDPKSCIRDS